jgi:hypothetical protein
MNSGSILDVEDDGRRLTFKMDVANDFECCISDAGICKGHDGVGVSTGIVTFDKAELLALLGGK